jgi:hypothetical protein
MEFTSCQVPFNQRGAVLLLALYSDSICKKPLSTVHYPLLMGGGSEKAFCKSKTFVARGSSDKKFIMNFKILTVYD